MIIFLEATQMIIKRLEINIIYIVRIVVADIMMDGIVMKIL